MSALGSRLYAGAGDGLEKQRLSIGFVPLCDCATVVIAKERGFFRKHGLEVTLSRESSWATLRDKLIAGALDAAPMLAPMPLAATLGLGGPSLRFRTGLALSLNGNAITVSRSLYASIANALGTNPAGPAEAGRALARVIRDRREQGLSPLRFGIVFPYSSHDLELRYWLAASGIDPGRDVQLHVVPPPFMVERLEGDALDGYCVGEPWNAVAALRGSGRVLVTKHQIWNHSPEKVLGVAEPWLDRHPQTHRAMLRALLEAAHFADDPDNRLEVAHVVCGESFVDAPVAAVRRSLCGSEPGESEDTVTNANLPLFHAKAASHPWVSHGVWFLGQMLRWGYIEKAISAREVAADVYRPDLHRQAASDLGMVAPVADEKPEGLHDGDWQLENEGAPIPMGSDRFFDGESFSAGSLISYLEGVALSTMRVRLDELAERNQT